MKCPECGEEMDHEGVQGVDGRGREQSVECDECPECGTIVTETGEVMTPEDQEQAIEKAKKALKDSLEERYGR